MAELELILQRETERRIVMLGIAVLMVIFSGLTYLVVSFLPNPLAMAFNLGSWAILLGRSIYRLYKLGKLFLRIGPDGIAWRLSNNIALFMEAIRPPFMEGDYSWEDMSSVEYRVDGIHLHFDDDDEELISLYNIDDADRQKIKSALKDFYQDCTIATDAD